MKKPWLVLMGVVLTALLVMPGLADELRASIKAVEVDKNIATVIEGERDYSFVVATADTRLLNANGEALAYGLKSGDLKAGRRVVVNFDRKDDTLIPVSLKI